jgi:hypothetical protein
MEERGGLKELVGERSIESSGWRDRWMERDGSRKVDGESWREVDGEKSMKKDSFNYDGVSSMSFHYFRKTLCVTLFIS